LASTQSTNAVRTVKRIYKIKIKERTTVYSKGAIRKRYGINTIQEPLHGGT